MPRPFGVVHALFAGALLIAGCAPSQPQISAATSAPTLAAAPDRFFTADGVSIRYRTLGAGEDILLLHGYSNALEIWGATADSLARDFRVIVPDLRGFGQSSKFGDPAQYGARIVDDLIGLLEHLDVPSAHVVGFSMGAAVAARLALRVPERVESATFIAGPFFPDSATAAQALQPFISALARGEGTRPLIRWIFPAWPDSLVDQAEAQVVATNDSASLVAAMRAMPALMADPARMARARTPAVAIVGLDDPGAESTRLVAQWWPGARLVEVAGRDHLTILQSPELLAAIRRLAGGA